MRFRHLAIAFAFFLTLAPAQEPKRAPDVPYVPTPDEVVQTMLKLADVKKSDLVYDLGCGDGRIVITAAKQYGAHGVGVDINPDRIREARLNAKQAGVEALVKFVEGDLFDADIKDASVVTLYLLPSINLKLRPKLWHDLKPGTRVVSHAFDMGDWQPAKRDEADGRSVYFWTIPPPK
jgi:SAM-dependent methyltransferase